jgi:hypothetical protein
VSGGIIAKSDFRVSSAGLCTPTKYREWPTTAGHKHWHLGMNDKKLTTPAWADHGNMGMDRNFDAGGKKITTAESTW